MSRILVVEDDAKNAQILERVLTRKGGHVVTLSQDVERILGVCERGEVDLVLLDVSLSGCKHGGEAVDGIWICHALKERMTTAQIPVVLVTAHAMRGDREHFLRASGANGYVTKPILDTQAFLHLLSELVTAGSQGKVSGSA